MLAALTPKSLNRLFASITAEPALHSALLGLRAQVYGFGGVSCVVDSSAGVVRAHIGGAWVLASLDQLLREARKRQRL